MRRSGNLFSRVLDRENLRLAYWKAARGKRCSAEVILFGNDLERNLDEIRAELADFTFAFGKYHQFKIRDPKPRMITAPCFPERVAHHAIMNVCEPHFERQLIDDCYACRKGKGREACLQRSQSFSRRYSSVLHLDISRYFDSISHELLLQRLERIFKDHQLLAVLHKLLATYEVTPRRGIPIGTLCSQHFANLYLADFDRFVKESLRIRGYVRYMDDFAIWSNDRCELAGALVSLTQWLESKLGLAVKLAMQPHGTQRGFDFLGHRVFPNRICLNRRSRRRYRLRIIELDDLFRNGEITAGQYQSVATSLTSFAASRLVHSWKSRSDAIYCSSRWVATSADDG